MTKRKPSPQSPSEVLRRAIVESGESLNSIQRATGVVRQCIATFVRGETTLHFDKAEKLMAYFEIECRQPRKRKRR